MEIACRARSESVGRASLPLFSAALAAWSVRDLFKPLVWAVISSKSRHRSAVPRCSPSLGSQDSLPRKRKTLRPSSMPTAERMC
jgi:hypothetical protein